MLDPLEYIQLTKIQRDWINGLSAGISIGIAITMLIIFKMTKFPIILIPIFLIMNTLYIIAKVFKWI